MPDLREVFEMVKQQTEPDLDSWAEQERRMRRKTRNRKTGAFALVAALTAIAAAVVVSLGGGDEGDGAATNPTGHVPPAPTAGFALVDINTGEQTGTGIVPDSSSIDVSPDGTRIVYVAWGGGAAASTPVVHVANVDGSNEQSFNATEGAQGPRWSPDGTTIVYQNKPEPGYKIGNLFILDVSTGKTTQITDLEQVSAGLWYMAPTFSPDGETVLFTVPFGSGNTKRWDLWSVPVTGGEPTLVKENAMGGDYSPNGESIAYSEGTIVDGQFGNGDLYVARSDGSGARKLVEGTVVLPRWSPDGTRIVYDDEGLSVLDVETGRARRILDYGNFADWVDDDTVILEMGD